MPSQSQKMNKLWNDRKTEQASCFVQFPRHTKNTRSLFRILGPDRSTQRVIYQKLFDNQVKISKWQIANRRERLKLIFTMQESTLSTFSHCSDLSRSIPWNQSDFSELAEVDPNVKILAWRLHIHPRKCRRDPFRTHCIHDAVGAEWVTPGLPTEWVT